ncbi:MAG TPA: hypothetical protein VM124_00085 [Candidatus Limnocylindrales bacterium]|nr:hypothetical protein [Candidatus Limnocylindrales bacterium]
MTDTELGILSKDLPEMTAAEAAVVRWNETFNRHYGNQPRCGVVVVYFAGTEGVMDIPDEPPAVNEYMANMIA